MSERAGLPIHCHIGSLPPLSVDVEQAVYRIAEEALLNAEKHAQATKIEVHLQHHASLLTLQVRDDGVGFSLDKVMGNGRFGLMGMQERADLIEAQLVIQTAPGSDTTIALRVKTG